MSLVSITVLDATGPNAKVRIVVRDSEGHTNAFDYAGELTVSLRSQNNGYVRAEVTVVPPSESAPEDPVKPALGGPNLLSDKADKMEHNHPRFDR